MARKDTINALIKRGVGQEDAGVLAVALKSLGAIGSSTVQEITALGIPEERAVKILAAVKDKPSSSSSSRSRKAAVIEAEPMKLFEASVKFGECDASEKKL